MVAQPLKQPNLEEVEAFLKNVQVQILEQPAENKHRFRYKSEGRATGTLLGESSSDEIKTYPKIKVIGYQGPAHVFLSCIDEKPPYRVHPNKLACKGNVYDRLKLRFDQSDMVTTIKNIGIQSITKTHIMESLKEKEVAKVDPFKQGYTFNPGLIILGKLRLCFEVVLEHPTFGLILMPPIVSQIVKDRKMFGELKIVDISENKAPFEGGKKIFLFCSKVQRSDIEIHFQFGNDSNNDLVIAPDTSEVHEQYGIKFTSPKCSFSIDNTRVQARVQCKLFLLKPSDGTISPSIDFYFVPSISSLKNANLKNTLRSLTLDEKSSKNQAAQQSSKSDSLPSTSNL